jgi:hypothetical protein
VAELLAAEGDAPKDPERSRNQPSPAQAAAWEVAVAPEQAPAPPARPIVVANPQVVPDAVAPSPRHRAHAPDRPRPRQQARAAWPRAAVRRLQAPAVARGRRRPAQHRNHPAVRRQAAESHRAAVKQRARAIGRRAAKRAELEKPVPKKARLVVEGLPAQRGPRKPADGAVGVRVPARGAAPGGKFFLPPCVLRQARLLSR